MSRGTSLQDVILSRSSSGTQVSTAPAALPDGNSTTVAVPETEGNDDDQSSLSASDDDFADKGKRPAPEVIPRRFE